MFPGPENSVRRARWRSLSSFQFATAAFRAPGLEREHADA